MLALQPLLLLACAAPLWALELEVPAGGIELEAARPRPLIRKHAPSVPEDLFEAADVSRAASGLEPRALLARESRAGGLLARYLWLALFSAALGTLLTGIALWRSRGLDVAAEELVPPRPGQVTSVFQILCMTSLNIGYGAMVATMAIFVLPKEAEQFFPRQSSLGLGLLELLGASSLLLGPLGGQLSDQTRHPLGRRRPMVLICTQIAMISTVGCWLASLAGAATSFGVCFLLQQVMWNCGHAAHCALLSDVVHPSCIGLASSLQTITTLLGGLLGMLAFQGLAAEGLHHSGIYGLQAILGYAFLPVLQLSAGEAASHGMLLPSEAVSFRSAFRFRLGEERSPDFRLVMWERTIYFVCAGAKSFVLFFLRDVLHVTRASDQAVFLAEAAMSNVSAAAAGGLLSSWLFTRFRLRPQRLAFAGSTLLALGTQFWVCSFFSSHVTSKVWLMGFFAIYGFGQGCYMSADLALAIDTLPDPDEASRYLGLWGLSAFVGAGVGGLGMGLVLELFGKVLPESYGMHVSHGRYCLHGYVALLLACCVCHLYVGKLCLQVRTRREYELDLSLLDRKGKTNAFLVETPTPSEKGDKEQPGEEGPGPDELPSGPG